MQHRLPILSFLLVITSFALIHIPKSFCQGSLYQTCGQAYRCGNIDFTYPFWGGNRLDNCGYPGFQVSCPSNIPMIAVSTIAYRVLDPPITTAHTFRVARDDFWDTNCPTVLSDTIFNFTIFSYSNTQNLTLSYGCPSVSPPTPRPPNEFDCSRDVNPTNYFTLGNAVGSNLGVPGLSLCTRNITVPINPASAQTLVGDGGLRAGMIAGFTLEYEANNTICERCSQSNGRCGYNTASNSFICYCSDRPYDLVCNPTARPQIGAMRLWLKFAIGLSVGVAALMSVIFYYLARRYSCWAGMIKWNSDEGKNQLVEEFMSNYGSIAPKLYTYSEIRKMTNSFAYKLGHGGYGCVYRGKLSDGRQVAVKVLNENKGDGEDFINEVAAISRTSHVNVVTLLGFCYNRKKRALIYEFMPNGSLDKFICKNGSSQIMLRDHLDWKLLYEITVGIARGLDYLHRGCNTRIVHFDIKPQNILLDTDFCPKISDFGLAKLCKRKESILSTMVARGTVGYIAPEVIFSSFGGVSHKSDVYSYGMMVLEMAGLTRKLQIDSKQTSENYFPNWIYEHIELGKDLPLKGVTNEQEKETATKMIFVGLWCIQTNPSDRPSISKVIEMLEGSLQSLQIPPKPILFSPTAMNPNQASWTTSSIL